MTPPRFPATTTTTTTTSDGYTTRSSASTSRRADVCVPSSSAMSMAAEAGAGAGSPVPGKSMLRSRAVGIGSSAPSTVLPNTDLEELVETSDEWIASRTGIRKRHLLKQVREREKRDGTACVFAPGSVRKHCLLLLLPCWCADGYRQWQASVCRAFVRRRVPPFFGLGLHVRRVGRAGR